MHEPNLLQETAYNEMLERFFTSGEAGITKQPHDFFGRMTPNEWARLQYLHLDHHFKQFGT